MAVTSFFFFFVMVTLCSVAALKIHCSQELKSILDVLGGYHLVERGLVDMKVQFCLLSSALCLQGQLASL